MNKVIAYSGIAAKTSAMKGKLISKKELSEIINLQTIPEMVTYLSNHPAYESLLKEINLHNISRSSLEKVIIYSPCIDIRRIFSFSGVKQKKFVNLYFISYQITYLKSLLRKLNNELALKEDSQNIEMLFSGHADIDFRLLLTSKTIDELILNLKGSMFYNSLNAVNSLSNPSLFDYETALDRFYLEVLWKVKNSFSSRDKKVIESIFGKQIDMLNLMWMYRIKKYYVVPVEDIRKIILPIHYKINKKQLRDLIFSEDEKEFLDIVKNTYYGKHVLKDEDTSFQYHYHNMLTKVFSREARSNPFSLATIASYLYLKEKEVKKLITIAECIRYSYSPEKIVQTLNTIGGAG